MTSPFNGRGGPNETEEPEDQSGEGHQEVDGKIHGRVRGQCRSFHGREHLHRRYVEGASHDRRDHETGTMVPVRPDHLHPAGDLRPLPGHAPPQDGRKEERPAVRRADSPRRSGLIPLQPNHPVGSASAGGGRLTNPSQFRIPRVVNFLLFWGTDW